MKHIAAVVHGDEFMIISPLAELRDLEVFLRGGYQPDPGTECLKKIYDFDTEFPLLNTSVKLRLAVVQESHRLACALKWLHEDLKIFGSDERYLAHMDFKPANVLVVGDPRGDLESPAGTWKLSDFGVSSFKKSSNAKDPGMPSIHDLGLQLTSRGLPEGNMRGRGSYQPPEVDLEDADSRKCDVWSFGCVLCDILAFAIGKTEAMYGFRNSRYKGGDDFFYEIFKPIGKEIDDSNTKLKSSVTEWWVNLDNGPSASWVKSYIKVLRKALKTKPSDRCNMADTVNGLFELGPSITSQANETLATSTVSQANEMVAPPSITITSEDSLTDRGINSPPDAAPESRDQVLASQNLQIHSGQQPKRGLVAGQNRNSDHRSSSTEFPNADVASMVNGERQPASVSISGLREQSKLFIPFPKNVKAIEIAPSTLQAGVLCQNSVRIYSTTDGREVTRYENLPSLVDWRKIRLVSQYFAVYGVGRSNGQHVSRSPILVTYLSSLCVRSSRLKIKIFNTTTMSEAVVANSGEQVQDILLSDEPVFAYIYGRSVKLYFLRSDTPYPTLAL